MFLIIYLCLIISNPLFLPGLQLLWKKRENWKIIPMWSEQCYGIHVSCTALYSVCLSGLNAASLLACCLPALAWPRLTFWFMVYYCFILKKTMRGMLDNLCFYFIFLIFTLRGHERFSVSGCLFQFLCDLVMLLITHLLWYFIPPLKKGLTFFLFLFQPTWIIYTYDLCSWCLSLFSQKWVSFVYIPIQDMITTNAGVIFESVPM